MAVILKRKKGFKWWTPIKDFKNDYLTECKKGGFTQNSTEYLEDKLNDNRFLSLLWADYKIF
ncbi:MAG: hypothetical protein L3J43_04965 [Sulfurovum sp.]|nr:hypothetical protein [Sulfurovum sp.]